jgi:CxxC motif-containing protein (DUF1111 family)
MGRGDVVPAGLVKEWRRWGCGLAFVVSVGGGSRSSLSAETRAPNPGASVPGAPIPDLDPSEKARYLAGREAFEADRSLLDGLGPWFNERSCSRCHNRGGVGGSGFQTAVVAGVKVGERFDALVAHGGPVVAQLSVTSLATETVSIAHCPLPAQGPGVPAEANVVTRRRTTPLFGLGLVEATPDSTFIALARQQPAGVRGRVAAPPRAPGFGLSESPALGAVAVGRFGWKAQFATLLEFSAAALRNELGVTNPLFPTEHAPFGPNAFEACDLAQDPEDQQTARLAADFARFLAPVPPLPADAAARAGSRYFTELGCDSCHVRNLRTGKSTIVALSQKIYHPYSDFLLHDMSSGGDGIAEGDARPSEMRTAPLWGLRLQPAGRWLHDGRARSLVDAIREHRGQGAAARVGFDALNSEAQAEVVAFLQTL